MTIVARRCAAPAGLLGVVYASGARGADRSVMAQAAIATIGCRPEEAPALAARGAARSLEIRPRARHGSGRGRGGRGRARDSPARSRRPRSRHPFTEIVGDAPAVRDVVKLLAKVVKSEATVLVHGESGTGKELIARAIHYHGPRAKKPFVVQNCSAFNDNLLESALFGHVRGAFTGAVKDQPGLFEVADGGTFFLDEIGDMSAALQVKLLRVLQEGTFTPVGGTKPVKVDVRIIAATHKDLATMVEHKQFREDLFYRINVIKITVPPLRERVSDIPRLVAALRQQALAQRHEARRRGCRRARSRGSSRTRGPATSASSRTRSSACSCSRATRPSSPARWSRTACRRAWSPRRRRPARRDRDRRGRRDRRRARAPHGRSRWRRGRPRRSVARLSRRARASRSGIGAPG